MSIKSEINKSATYLRSARRAILGRGGEISLTAGLKDLPEAIYKIPADASLAYQVDDSVAYRKIVPASAEEFAQVAKVGGMTRKCNNLIPFPYKDAYRTIYNVSFSDNGDYGVRVNGTATGAVYFALYENDWKAGTYTLSYGGDTFPAGLYIVASYYKRNANGGTSWVKNIGDIRSTRQSLTFEWTKEDEEQYILRLNITVSENITVNNFVVYPMLNEGDTALPYEPYFAGLRDTEVSELVSEGANLLNIMAEISVPSNTSSSNTTKRFFTPNTMILGMAHNNYYDSSKTSLVKRTQDSITFTHGSGYGASFAFDLKPNTQYTISCMSDITDTLTTAVAFYSTDGTFENFLSTRTKSLTFTTNSCGKTLLVWTDTRGNYGDVIEVTVSNIMLNEGGTAAPYKQYKGTIDTLEIPEEIQAIEGYGQSNPDNPNEYNYIDFGGVFVGKGHIVDGKWIAYGEPKEIDISQFITDSFIAVEGGGSIKAVNEYEYDAPSTINYIYKTVGE